MAKKKSGRKPKETAVRSDLITMRCTAAFKGWLDDVATAEQRLASVVIERALRAYAEANGHQPPPER